MIDNFRGPNFFLSNFFMYPITFDGITYPSAEHCYQSLKTDDIEKRKDIALIKTAGLAKKFGQVIKLSPDWEQRKIGVMEMVVREKFKTPLLAAQLLATGDEELVEKNTCNGKGENHLGKILMKIREELRK